MDERETVIAYSQRDRVRNGMCKIDTTIKADITKLKRHPGARLIAEGDHFGTPWARFEVCASQFSPTTGIRRPRAAVAGGVQVLGSTLTSSSQDGREVFDVA